MAKLISIYWRDIPAQVVGRQGRTNVKKELEPRFAKAIDRADESRDPRSASGSLPLMPLASWLPYAGISTVDRGLAAPPITVNSSAPEFTHMGDESVSRQNPRRDPAAAESRSVARFRYPAAHLPHMDRERTAWDPCTG